MENGKIKALIIDSTILQRNTIQSYLTAQAECMGCKTVVEGLGLLKDYRFDIVVAEFELDRLEESISLGLLKQKQPDLKIIATTRTANEKLVYAALRHHIDGILVKPINSKALVQKIQEVIDMPLVPTSRVFSPATLLSFKIDNLGNFTVISLIGKLVGATLSSLRSKIDTLCRQGRKHIALDLEKLTEIDPNAFNFLSKLFEYLKRSSGILCLFNVFNHLQAIMNNMEAMDKLPIYLDSTDFRMGISREFGMAFPKRTAAN